MPETDGQTFLGTVWGRRTLSTLKYFSIVAVAVLIVGAATFLLVSAWEQGKPRSIDSVDAEWSRNIRRLGIEPVYPPQEDVAVGDLYAIAIEGKGAQDAQTIPLPGHSVRLTHLDLTQELEDQYKSLYVFPDTKPRPTAALDVWEQQQSTGSIFTPGPMRTSLPIVLFPGITIARAREAVGGFGGVVARVAALLGASRQENENIDLRISVAETYGIGSIPATKRLAQFCVDPLTKPYSYRQGRAQPAVDGHRRSHLRTDLG